MSCTGSSLIFGVRPSPCPGHYAGRWATMPSADFCLVTARVTQRSAIVGHRVRSLRVDETCAPGQLNQRPSWDLNDRVLSRSPQIRTCTVTAQLHHLRWPLDHLASSSCANSPPAYASYDVLVHQLAVLLAASSRPTLAGKPLPFASS
jgi:hypothetical protein